MLSILAQEGGGGSSIAAFLPLILIGAVFYFLLIRPQQRRAKQQQALVRSVDVGDEIVTTSGILGTVIEIDEEDDVLTVEIAPDTQIRMVRAGVGRLVEQGGDDEDEGWDEDEDEGEEGEGDDERTGEQPGPFSQQ